jgi:hypothetical protein
MDVGHERAAFAACSLSPKGLRHAHISGRRAYRVRCEGARHMVPSPLVGEGQGEGWPQSTEDEAPPDWRTVNGCRAGLIGSWIRTKSSAAIPLSLSLPHKGGGNVVALLCPFPRNAPAYGSEMCACLSASAGTNGIRRRCKLCSSRPRVWRAPPCRSPLHRRACRRPTRCLAPR